MKLADKVAIITGGAQGIGRGIARCFAREGADIVIADLQPEKMQEVVREIKSLGRNAIAVNADVSLSAQADNMVKTAVAEFGKLDILINNAGIAKLAPFYELSDEDWDRIMRVNLYGCFFCSRAASREMIKRREGKILSMASITGVMGSVRRAAYGVSKGAVITLTKVMAAELAPYGINVNALAPGPIVTEMTGKNLGPQAFRYYQQRVPLGRYGDIEDIAEAALFLCSAAAKYITGHVMAVDGGFLSAGLLERD